jgi:hypothetical protein
MKRTGLIRLGGLAAMVGGIALVILGLVTWLCIPNCPRSLGYIASVFFVLLVLGAMAAIAALHLLQRERYGLLGTLAFLVAFVGVAMIFVDQLRNLVNPDVAAFSWLFFIGLLVATVGIIAYGVVTTKAGVVPWWCGAALIAGSPLIGLFLYLFSPVEDLLLGIPWIVVGFAVFRAAGLRTVRPSRVR